MFCKVFKKYHDNTGERARTHVDLGSDRRIHEMSRKILQNLTETSFIPVFLFLKMSNK